MSRSRRRIACSERLCGKGTSHGAAAEASPYGYAPCVLPLDHSERCDSGPAPEPDPDLFGARRAA